MSPANEFFRRQQDFPLLVLSQDYELFFHRSGSTDKCLFEPTDLLLDFAESRGLKITFFVDAGMLCRMAALESQEAALGRELSRIQAHIASIAARGHEIGLHIHPHWEDTRRVDGAWDFSNTRYQLRDFSAEDARDIVNRYTAALNDLCDGAVTTYRAGGFCIEPFDRLRGALAENGILVDSSIVPGMAVRDPAKGIDFGKAPDRTWWRFGESPLKPDPDGEFLELPVTPSVLPFWHYWGRAVDRLKGRQPRTVTGDGASKAIGRWEILRRLAGFGRASELSADAPKAGVLEAVAADGNERPVWHVMGHPKLLGKVSLEALAKFIDRKGIRRFETLSGLAAAIRAKELSSVSE